MVIGIEPFCKLPPSARNASVESTGAIRSVVAVSTTVATTALLVCVLVMSTQEPHKGSQLGLQTLGRYDMNMKGVGIAMRKVFER